MDIQIPYTTDIREDTGLYNAKLGVWLFLASEVMLFAGLFSAYLLLRVGADTWPQGLLSVPLGTLNTFVLIASSITIVMAWASLKMKDFQGYRRYLGVTLLCAVVFLGIKSYEYRDKFTHYEVRLVNGTTLTGHLEGSPWVMTLPKLQATKAATVTFHPDPEKGAHAGGHLAPMKIALADIKRLTCFGPWLNTYLGMYFTVTAIHGLHVIGGIVLLAWLWGPGAAMWRREPERLTNRVETAGLYWHFVDLVWLVLFPVFYLT